MLRTLACLLLLALGAQARSDIFLNREWEPDFRVLASSLLQAADGEPSEHPVFTCVLNLSDLQLRRCDAPDAAPADSLGGSCYRAEYEISLEIFQGKGRHQRARASRYLHQTLTLDRTHADVENPRRWHHLEVELPPGDYTWWVEFQDLQSRRHVRREGRFKVTDLKGCEQAISGLWLLAESDSQAVDPLLARPFVEERGGAHPAELAVFYQVWSRGGDSLDLHSQILDRRETERHKRTLRRWFPAGLTRNLLQVPLQALGSGDYLLELRLGDQKAPKRRDWREGQEGKDRTGPARRLARFTVRWQGEPGNPGDLDRAVEQLRYILPARRFRELQEALMSQKKALFDDFWRSVDPTPENEVNELMGEYYRRAEFADRRFSWSRFAGWRSDRGRIYMIYGDPDEVERSAGDLDEPAWERWSYEESGREFFFLDRLGFGDYQLVLDPTR
ncbi:MAG: GWxTD domain-containing protein [Candidatus Delongbacteria bacterium]